MLSCKNTVINLPNVDQLATRALAYLHETLDVSTATTQPWHGRDELPYFIRDAFDFECIELHGTAILLAQDRRQERSSPRDIKTWLETIRSLTGYPVVYVTDSVVSYERKRLIEQKVPFIVPGNQLYLPDLGIDLREYFRQWRGPTQAPLSPSAQALLITALLRQPWAPEWYPGEAAALLGYSSMTISRTVHELAAAGLAEIHKVGRSQYLAMKHAPREMWEQANPLMRSPVQRSIWTATTSTPQPPLRIAGLSALASQTMLNEPRIRVCAINRTTWLRIKAEIEELPEARPGAQEWQLWNYSPMIEPATLTVDPLSLILSLRDNTDDRVQEAIDVLKEQLPW